MPSLFGYEATEHERDGEGGDAPSPAAGPAPVYYEGLRTLLVVRLHPVCLDTLPENASLFPSRLTITITASAVLVGPGILGFEPYTPIGERIPGRWGLGEQLVAEDCSGLVLIVNLDVRTSTRSVLSVRISVNQCTKGFGLLAYQWPFQCFRPKTSDDPKNREFQVRWHFQVRS